MTRAVQGWHMSIASYKTFMLILMQMDRNIQVQVFCFVCSAQFSDGYFWRFMWWFYWHLVTLSPICVFCFIFNFMYQCLYIQHLLPNIINECGMKENMKYTTDNNIVTKKNRNCLWQMEVLTFDSSSMFSVNTSSPGRRIHDTVSAVTNCSDNIGGSGCDGAATVVVYIIGAL